MAHVPPIRGRNAFATMRRDGVRFGGGHLSVTALQSEAVAVSYAIGSHVGNAVVRNRIRRRLRCVISSDLASVSFSSGLAPVSYLVSVKASAASASFDELRDDLVAALAGVNRRVVKQVS